ncbi:MAG: hypothetical protein DWP95_08050 [Proteobacteria bacterium]|nr:MAG: hypothetical protein DWP95_08050 [Pseudomonadota bacterium]
MNKLILMVLFLFSTSVFSHDFLTEILVYSDDYDANPYHVAVSYDLGEQDILTVINLRQTKSDLSKMVVKSNAKEIHHEHSHVGPASHEHESEIEATVGHKTHGAFDHITESRLVAIDLCDAFAVTNYMKYPQGLIPQFVGPETFTDGVSASQDHHELYQYADGLQFNCIEVIKQKSADLDLVD